MTVQRLLPALVFACTMTACDTNASIATINLTTAEVRVLNASTTQIDLLKDQAVAAGNSAILFGGSSNCMTVDIVSHGLSIRPSAVHTTTTPLPSFSGNEHYAVIATGGTSALAVTPFRNSFTPSAGKAAIRLINVGGASAGSYDMYVNDPTLLALSTTTAANVANGAASAFVEIPTTKQQVRLTTNSSTTVAFDLGNITLAAGDRADVVIAPPASGGSTLRAFIYVITAAAGC